METPVSFAEPSGFEAPPSIGQDAIGSLPRSALRHNPAQQTRRIS